MKKSIILLSLLMCVLYLYGLDKYPGEKGFEPVHTTVSAGPYHYMVIKENGELLSWGDNQWGALGRDKDYPDTPADAVKVLDNIVSISTSEIYSLAIDKEGGLWAWGDDSIYRTFSGFIAQGYGYNHPAKILEDVAMVSAGQTILVVKKDQSLWGWGNYTYGNLADGRYNTYIVDGIGEVPTEPGIYSDIEEQPVKIMDNVSYALSDTGEFAVKTDGTLWAWGYNKNGELGDGTLQTQIYPVKIMDDVKFIGPGPYAIKTDGSLWTWGLAGETDTIPETEDLLPKMIMENVRFASRFYGNQSVAIQEDGSLWTWGNDDFGQLGDGTTVSRNEPVKIMDEIVYAAGNSFSTLALKEDGSLWHMGLYHDAVMNAQEALHLPHKVLVNIMLP